jgi:hypothetical protein
VIKIPDNPTFQVIMLHYSPFGCHAEAPRVRARTDLAPGPPGSRHDQPSRLVLSAPKSNRELARNFNVRRSSE